MRVMCCVLSQDRSSTQLPSHLSMTTKALLIGETDSGKTQLLRRYADDQFSDSYVATVGIDFKAKTQALDDGRSFNLQLWDTAGHERYRSLTTAYYRGAAYFMICLDMSKTVAHNTPVLATFYNLVQTHASSAVVTVVGTKKDLTQQTTLAQLKTMAAVHGVGAGFVFETSAKTGDTNVVTAMKGILGATFPPPVSATLTRTKSKPSSPTLTLPASATKSLAPTASTSPSPSTSLSRPPTLTSNPTLTANPTRTTNPTLSPRPTSSRDPSSTPTRPRTLSAKPTPSMRLSDTVELLADGSSSSSSSASAAAAVAASSSSSSAASTKSSSSTASSSSFASSSSSAVPVKVVASASSSSSSEVSRPSSSSSSASASASVPPRPMSSKASSSVYSSSSSASSSALSSSAVASSSSSSDGVSETPAPIAGPDAGRGVGGRVAGGSGTSFASSGGGIALFTILGVACIVALVVAVVVLLIVKQRAAAKKAAGEDDGSSAGSELPSDTASPQSPQPNDPFDESNAVVGRPVSSAVFADSAADAATPVKPVAVVPGPVTHAAAKEPPQTTTKKAPPQKKTKPTAKSTTKRVRSPKPSREEV